METKKKGRSIMTSINGVEGVVYAQPQERKGKHTALRHIGNAAVTAAGVVGAGKLYKSATVLSQRMLGEAMPKNGSYFANTMFETPLTRFGKKIIASCEKLGEKLFKNGKIAFQLEKMATESFGSISPEAASKALKSYKGRTVMGIAAGATALAFLVHGIFKAGEIKGEAK
jgi:hypothetical protein